MKKVHGMHPAQSAILYTLRHAKTARFSDLLKQTALSSDAFKFHVRKVMSLGYIAKTDDGLYELTPRGKEYANRLDETTGLEIEQPKSSILLVGRTVKDGEVYYLAHQRKREPFYGFWGIGSAPVLRGDFITVTAGTEFLKQTGIPTEFEIRGTLHVIDKTTEGEVLEDKLFAIAVADIAEMIQPHEWYGGKSTWMTREELLSQDRVFPTTALTLGMIDTQQHFAEEICIYSDSDY